MGIEASEVGVLGVMSYSVRARSLLRRNMMTLA